MPLPFPKPKNPKYRTHHWDSDQYHLAEYRQKTTFVNPFMVKEWLCAKVIFNDFNNLKEIAKT